MRTLRHIIVIAGFLLALLMSLAGSAGAQGFSIPAGSLDAWYAARNNAKFQRVETVHVGDSTTDSQSANYSWVYRLRHDSIAAAFADGGRGMGTQADTATRSGPDENLSCIQSITGFAAGSDNYDFFPGNMHVSNTVGDTITLQGRGSLVRLFYTQHSSRGQFTYSLDGGAAVTVDAYSASNLLTGIIPLTTSGGTGVHTLTVTNIGRALSAPAQIAPNWSSPAATGFSSGTYYYTATATNASGETTIGTVYSVTVPNGPRPINGNIVNRGSDTGYKLYRSTSGGGPYQLIYTLTKTGGTYTGWSDDNTVTPGANAPSTNTAGSDPTARDVHVLADWLKPTGVVYHKAGISGATFQTFGLNGAYNNFPYEVNLGLKQIDGTTTPDLRPPGRNVTLAICDLGINDAVGGSTDTSGVAAGVQKFITAARSAGAVPLIVLPHFKRNASAGAANAALFTAAEKAVAVSNNCAWCDFDAALDASGYSATNGNSPHLDQTGYNIEADYLWNNVLGINGPANPSGNAKRRLQ